MNFDKALSLLWWVVEMVLEEFFGSVLLLQLFMRESKKSHLKVPLCYSLVIHLKSNLGRVGFTGSSIGNLVYDFPGLCRWSASLSAFRSASICNWKERSGSSGLQQLPFFFVIIFTSMLKKLCGLVTNLCKLQCLCAQSVIKE